MAVSMAVKVMRIPSLTATRKGLLEKDMMVSKSNI